MDAIQSKVAADFSVASEIVKGDFIAAAGLVQAMAIYRVAAKNASRPTTQAGEVPRASVPARPASSPAPTGQIPNCSKCGAPGQVNKFAKPGSKAPPFSCTACTTEAKNGKVYATGIWPEPKKTQNTAYAEAYSAQRGRNDPESFEENPLQDEDDDLPF